ncbi:MAG: acyl carrier protein [Bacteroidota bacterium]
MNDILIDYIQNNLLDADEAFQLTADEDLLSSGLVDSVGMMNLIAFIEEEFGLPIPPEDMVIEHFITVENMVNYLERRKSN